MNKSTEMFLQSNRRNFQSKMKKYEFCPSDMKAGQAIREIKKDLLGKLIHFQKERVYLELLDLKMIEFKNVAGKKYWRAVPTWGTYLDPRSLDKCKKVAAGEYMPAGGEKTKAEMIRVSNLPIIEVE